MLRTTAYFDPMQIRQKKSKLPPNVIWLGVVSMLNDMSGEIVARALPIFLVGTLGVGFGLIGLIEGIADTTSSLLKLISGRMSDRTGKRKPMALFGYTLTAFARPILLLTSNWIIPLISRFADRAGKGIRSAPRDALVADSVNEHERGRAFGFHRAMDPLGAVLGALIGAGVLYFFTPDFDLRSLTISREMFDRLIVIATIPTILSVIAVWFFIREPLIKRSTRPRAKIFGAGIDKRFNRLLGVILIFTLGSSSDAFLVLRASSAGLAPYKIFLLIASFNLVTALAAYPIGILSDRWNRKNVLRIGWLYYALIYSGFAYFTDPSTIAILFIAYGMFYALTEGAEKAFVADLVTKENRGTAYGLYNASVGLAALPASLIAGFLWQRYGAAVPFVFGGALALIAAFALSFIPEAKVATPIMSGSPQD